MAPSSNQRLLQKPLHLSITVGTLLVVKTEGNGKTLHRWLRSPPDRNALILYEITGKQLEPALESKVGGGEKLADSNMMGAPIRFLIGIPEFCSWATEHLPAYVWASCKNDKVNSQPPSFRGSYFLSVFFFFFFLSHPGKRALMDGDFYFKGLFSFLGRSDILVTHPNSSCRGKSAKG